MNRTARSRTTLTTLAALGLLTVAGCGSDKDTSATTQATTATTASPASTSTAAPPTQPGSTTGSAPHTLVSDAYCDAEMDLNAAASAAGDPESAPAAFASALLAPAMAAAALAPAGIADTFTSTVTALQAVAGGDQSQLEAMGAGSTQINEFDVANCPWTKVPVTMENYHFTGMPTTLPAGDYVFQLDNTGNEAHVLVIVKRKSGVTESFDELLNDPDGESKVDTIIANGTGPGGTADAIGRLDAGDYLVLCPVPVGTTGDTEGTGPPHFTVGMRQPLTVTA